MANQPRQTRENKVVNWSASLRPKVGDVVSFSSASWVNITGLNGEPGVSNDWERQFPQSTAQGDIDLQLNVTSENAIGNKPVAEEFVRTNNKPLLLSNVTNLAQLTALNYAYGIGGGVTINLFDNTIGDFSFKGFALGGNITFQMASSQTATIEAPDGLIVEDGKFYQITFIESANKFYLFIFNIQELTNITEIQNRSYDDLQDLPTLGDLASLDSVNTAQIVNNAVTNFKLANMNANTIKGRATVTGVPQDLTASQVRSILELQFTQSLTPPGTGTFTIQLSVLGTDYSGTATDLEVWDVSTGQQLGSKGVIKFNGTVEPSVTGASKVISKSNPFQSNTDLYFFFEVFDDGVKYWFVNFDYELSYNDLADLPDLSLYEEKYSSNTITTSRNILETDRGKTLIIDGTVTLTFSGSYASDLNFNILIKAGGSLTVADGDKILLDSEQEVQTQIVVPEKSFVTIIEIEPGTYIVLGL